eukprot:364931-Chlamydomonas_euryale.AAC.5
MHEGPVLTFTLLSNLGKVILAHTMLDSAYCLGLSRLPRPWSGHGLGYACTKCPSASGLGHACPWSRVDLGLGKHDRLRPAALTHVL